ncbi:MAG TPA: hypothetical protein PL133_02725 [Methylophilaceae bacterium]|nr:hypothetical protein [Methylophilaceae bacterium]HQC29164.1 hypothetical protein [Methylotenera sp.]
MNQFLSSLPTMLGGLLIAAATYWFTKKKEREAEWRKEKLAYYKAFIESLSGIAGSDNSIEGQRTFTRASNNLLLFAPQSVVQSLENFRSGIRVSNDLPIQEHDKLLTTLIKEIRKDIKISPSDSSEFSAKIWASGTNPQT